MSVADISLLALASSTSLYISIAAAILTAFLIKNVCVFTFWSRRGIHGPAPVPFFGNIIQRMRAIVPDLELLNLKTYGKIYGYYEMSRPVLYIADPDILRSILVRDFSSFVDRRHVAGNQIQESSLNQMRGDEWRRVRHTLTPTFTSGKMKAMMPLMQGCLDLLEKAISDKQKDGSAEVDVKRLFGCYTMDVIAKCAFATDTNAHEQKPGSYADIMFKILNISKLRILPMLILPPWFLNKIGYSFSPPGTREFLEQAVREIIRQRRESSDGESNGKRRDMLQLLLEAAAANAVDTINNNDSSKDQGDDEVADSESHHDHESSLHPAQAAIDQKASKVNNSTKKYLKEEEIVANTFLFLFAGYETTATLLTYTSYVLALNQSKQDKLREEVMEVIKSGRPLDYETVSSLKYLDAVICESLRMFPPVITLQRMSTIDEYVIEKINLKVGKGQAIRVPVYAMHHLEEFFPDPDRFKPERFLPENRSKVIPYTYLPFGAGPRNCIGMRFALLEAKMALASCVLHHMFLPCSRTPASPDFSKAQLLLSTKDIFVRIQPIGRGESKIE